MQDSLILYIDTDYIVPIVELTNGHYSKYPGSENCLWTYFFKDELAGTMTYGKNYKSNYYSTKVIVNYYGDFWKFTGEEEMPLFEFNSGSFPYIELLYHSGLLRDLSSFYQNQQTMHTGKIPTAVIFSGSINEQARINFINYLEKYDFSVFSFSRHLAELAVLQFLQQNGITHSSPHDKIMVMQASGRNLYLSHLTSDGNSFRENVDIQVFKDKGENPLRYSLVKYVVDTINRDVRLLSSEEDKQREYQHQMAFVDQWIEQYQASTGLPVFLQDIYFLNAPTNKKDITVEKSLIDTLVKQYIYDISTFVGRYKDQHIKTNFTGIILLGDALDNETICKEIGNAVSNVKLVAPYSLFWIPDILHQFHKTSFAHKNENPGRYREIMQKKEDEKKQFNTWLEQSSSIISLHRQLESFQKEFDTLLEDIRHKKSGCEYALERNEFIEAQAEIDATDRYFNTYDELCEKFDKVKLETGTLLRESHKFQALDNVNEIIGSIKKHTMIS